MAGNKLQCFFAFSDDIQSNKAYVDMLVATLKSAQQNTTLELHCLYDGKKDDKLHKILQKYNVITHIATIPFAEKIYEIYTPEYTKKMFGYEISKGSLRSRFLRMLLTEYTNDKYILYCDTDIIFLKDIKLSDFETLPEYVGVCPEFDKSQNYSYFNAGIMLINVKNAKQKYLEFLSMINNNQTAKIECCDQGYLNDLYENLFDRLPLEYNWKPYYGFNPNAKIIHFHGIKPNQENYQKLGFLSRSIIKHECISAYYQYYSMFCEYSGIDKMQCLDKLTQTIMCNISTNVIDNRRFIRLRKRMLIMYIALFVLVMGALFFTR